MNDHMKTMTILKEALEKIKHLKSTYYLKLQSGHIPILDSMGRNW